MARAIWKGLISFGLVNIPVELHTAARDHTPHFRLLHQKDLSPISMERVCQKDGQPVAWADVVKGYEIEKGHFVTVTEDDFKTAALERSRRIEILAFVPRDSIDMRYWDTPYLVMPSSGAEHSYVLLSEALVKSGRAGVSKYVMRERQHLAALVPLNGRLLVSTMRFPEDLVELPAVQTKTKPSAQEMRLAQQLIEGMAEPWNPSKYTDDYVKALMKVIEAKAEGEVIRHRLPRPPARTNVVDLVARLQESLAAARKSGKSAAMQGSAKAAKAKGGRRRKRGKAA
ncbi:MAG: Ku protein [Vicinamibacterales bacterium]